MSLLNRYQSKPQNQFSEHVQKKAIYELRDWLIANVGLPEHQAYLLAEELVFQAIENRRKATAPSAPNVHLSDKSKVEALVFAGQVLADQLDQKQELENLLENLLIRNAQEPGNSL